MLYDKKNKFKVAMPQFHFQLYKMIVPILIILGLIMRIKQITKKHVKKTKTNALTKFYAIQVSQEAGQVTLYSHLFQNFPVYCNPNSQSFWHSQ